MRRFSHTYVAIRPHVCADTATRRARSEPEARGSIARKWPQQDCSGGVPTSSARVQRNSVRIASCGEWQDGNDRWRQLRIRRCTRHEFAAHFKILLELTMPPDLRDHGRAQVNDLERHSQE